MAQQIAGTFLIATFVGLLAVGCNVIGMTFYFDPDGPLGWLSKGLITLAGIIFVAGLTIPLWALVNG